MNTFDKKVHKVRGSLEFLSHFYLTVDVESIGFEKKLPFRIEYENLSPGIIGALLYETDCKCHKFIGNVFLFISTGTLISLSWSWSPRGFLCKHYLHYQIICTVLCAVLALPRPFSTEFVALFIYSFFPFRINDDVEIVQNSVYFHRELKRQTKVIKVFN